MPVTVDAIKELAIRAMKRQYGDSIGAAYAFLMFGGYGLPGLVDGATLIAKGDQQGSEEFTENMALSFVTDAAKLGLQKTLEASAASVLEEAGITAEVFASTAALVVTGLLEPSTISPEPNPLKNDQKPVVKPFPTNSGGGGKGGLGEGRGGGNGSSTSVNDVVRAAREQAASNGLRVGEVTVTEEGGDGRIISIRMSVQQQ